MRHPIKFVVVVTSLLISVVSFGQLLYAQTIELTPPFEPIGTSSFPTEKLRIGNFLSEESSSQVYINEDTGHIGVSQAVTGAIAEFSGIRQGGFIKFNLSLLDVPHGRYAIHVDMSYKHIVTGIELDVPIANAFTQTFKPQQVNITAAVRDDSPPMPGRNCSPPNCIEISDGWEDIGSDTLGELSEALMQKLPSVGSAVTADYLSAVVGLGNQLTSILSGVNKEKRIVTIEDVHIGSGQTSTLFVGVDSGALVTTVGEGAIAANLVLANVEQIRLVPRDGQPGGNGQKQITLGSGWNSVYIGTSQNLPVSQIENAGCASPIVMGLDAGSLTQVSDSMRSGEGYLIRVNTGCSISLPGSLQDRSSINLSSGWNITGVATDTSAAKVYNQCGNMIIMGLENGALTQISSSATLEALKGYLIRSGTNCIVSVSGPGAGISKIVNSASDVISHQVKAQQGPGGMPAIALDKPKDGTLSLGTVSSGEQASGSVRIKRDDIIPSDAASNWEANVEGGNWLSISKNSGALGPDESASFTVTADTSTLSGGTHEANIKIRSASAATPNPVTVRIDVTDSNGGGGSGGELNASFNVSNRTPQPNETVTFTDTSSTPQGASISSWQWEFGDGNSGTGASVSHAFSSPGQYNVRLTVRDTQGNQDTASQMITVQDGGGGPQDELTASFEVSNLTAKPNQSITFTSTSSAPQGQSITSWQWRFDDGNSDSGSSVSHAYSNTGQFTVRLTIQDNQGNQDSASRTITVQEDGGGGTGDRQPNANFNYSPDAPSVGNSVSFEDTSSDPDGRIVSREWQFPDGSTSSGRTASYTFNRADTFSICLEVQDNDGLTDSTCRDVAVTETGGGGGQGLTAEFSWTPRSPKVGETVRFTDESTPSGAIISRKWSLIENHLTDARGTEASFTYMAAATYEVCLTVMDASGDTERTCHQLDVSHVSTNVRDQAFATAIDVDSRNPINRTDQFSQEAEQVCFWLDIGPLSGKRTVSFAWEAPNGTSVGSHSTEVGQFAQLVDSRRVWHCLDTSYYLVDLYKGQPGDWEVTASLDGETITTDQFTFNTELNVNASRLSTSSYIFSLDSAHTHSMQVTIYNLEGKAIFNSGRVRNNTLRWSPLNQPDVPANGVYLYRVTAYTSSGNAINTEIKKLVVLR